MPAMYKFRNTDEQFGDTTTTYEATSPEALAAEVNHLFTAGAAQEWLALDNSDEFKDEFCTRRALELLDAFLDGLEIVE